MLLRIHTRINIFKKKSTHTQPHSHTHTYRLARKSPHKPTCTFAPPATLPQLNAGLGGLIRQIKPHIVELNNTVSEFFATTVGGRRRDAAGYSGIGKLAKFLLKKAEELGIPVEVCQCTWSGLDASLFVAALRLLSACVSSGGFWYMFLECVHERICAHASPFSLSTYSK